MPIETSFYLGGKIQFYKIRQGHLIFVYYNLLCSFKFQLYNYFEDSNYVYLVLEMCHNGEMNRYLKNRRKPFSENEGRLLLLFLLGDINFTFFVVLKNVLLQNRTVFIVTLGYKRRFPAPNCKNH